MSSQSKVGSSFSTGNSVVATLPVGTQLEVSSKGQLTIVEVPHVEAQPGQRFQSKYGPATVVRVTSTRGLDDAVADLADGMVVYIADGTNVVRVTSAENVN